MTPRIGDPTIDCGRGRDRQFVALVGALALLADCAMAQSAERPEVSVGDRWTFAAYHSIPSAIPNRTWQVTAVTATGIEGTEDGEPLRLTRDLNVIESPRIKESNPRLLAFPLSVGKRWRFESDWEFKPKGSSGKFVVDVAVTAYEKVKVPAGEFDAFKLSAREALSGTSPAGSRYAGEATRTYWYAPAARAIVKSVAHNPYLGSTSVELVGIELRP